VKILAGILGIIAGAWTFVLSWAAIVAGVFLGGLFGDVPYLATIGLIALILSAVAVFGGVLAFFKPRIGGCGMLIGSVGAILLTVVLAHGYGVVAAILPMIALIAGGVLALAKGR
jgi:hypothetical protein